jgi:hypothetical protein
MPTARTTGLETLIEVRKVIKMVGATDTHHTAGIGIQDIGDIIATTGGAER